MNEQVNERHHTRNRGRSGECRELHSLSPRRRAADTVLSCPHPLPALRAVPKHPASSSPGVFRWLPDWLSGHCPGWESWGMDFTFTWPSATARGSLAYKCLRFFLPGRKKLQDLRFPGKRLSASGALNALTHPCLPRVSPLVAL